MLPCNDTMPQPPVHSAHLIRDSLDRAVVLYRSQARTILSQLIAVQAINLALLSLLVSLLGLTPSALVLWRVPVYVGNPFSLFDTLFFSQPDLDPRVATILVADVVVVLTCLRVLFIPLFARQYQPHVPLLPRNVRFLQSVLTMVVPSSLLLSLLALTLLLVRSVLPFNPLVFVLRPAPLGISLGQLFLAAIVFALAGPLISARFALAPHISLLEQCSGIRSLVRSWQLTQPAWRLVFGLLLATDGLLALVIFLRAILAILDILTPLPIGQLNVLMRLGGLILGGLALVIVPFQTATTTILYLELRRRIEGTDLEADIQAIRSPGTTEPSSRGGT
jgi:hypothetical protein